MASPDQPSQQPHVLIVGGLLTPPVAYRRLRLRLLERGAARVAIAPVSALDWAWAGLFGFGALQRKVVRAVVRAHASAGGQQIVIVGHSGGGLLGRLAMSDSPYRGRVGGMAVRVGCLVTLGSPHHLHRAPLGGTHEGVRLAAFLDRCEPGAHHAPGSRYVTVASDAVAVPTQGDVSHRSGPVARLQHAFFRRITGPTIEPGSDGIVSLALAHLDGALPITFHDTLHGVVGGPWYGDAAIVDRWWPIALEAWRRSAAPTTDP